MAGFSRGLPDLSIGISRWTALVAIFLMAPFSGVMAMGVRAGEISREQALELARATQEAKAFYALMGGSLEGCAAEEVVRPCNSEWVTCIDEAWVVKFGLMENCRSPKNEQLGVTLLIDGKTGAILSRYPEIDYFRDPFFCRDAGDCRVSRTNNIELCANFVHALVQDPLAETSDHCACVDARCETRN